ncbi:hypothetical protein ACJIZ3_022229 [Penstemon smallii]|uniref:WRKY domain-containing protein n=1 Tax=Penstemon smallii TaxID=265156 RepID=A0ABD3SP09_9LAMI
MQFSSTTSGVPTQLTRLIGELTRGRQMADQLRAMLRSSSDGDGDGDGGSTVLPFRGMVEKIMDTFTESISIANAGCTHSDEVSQLPPPPMNSPGPKSEHSGESSKTPPGSKDRRGCYKRRRTSETWTKETPSLFEDGHAWRKYGQKVILRAKHPRNYFRCTHKYDENCQATKQVQKIQDEPVPLFRTTYHGHHTCKNLIIINSSSHDHSTDHEMHIMDGTAQDNSSSIIWSFQRSNKDDHHHHHNDHVASAAAVIKQEMYQITKSSSSSISHSADHDDFFNISPHDHEANYHHRFSSSTNFDHTNSPSAVHHHDNNLNGISSSDDVISSTDVYSCTASTHSHSMDMQDMLYFDDLPEF